MWSVGMISDQTFKQLNVLCDFQSFIHASESCEKAQEIADEEIGDIDMYSIFTPPCTENSSSVNRLWKRKGVSAPIFRFCTKLRNILRHQPILCSMTPTKICRLLTSFGIKFELIDVLLVSILSSVEIETPTNP